MARPIKERVFDPSKPLFAVRSFTANGHTFEKGKPFAWRRLAIDQRRVRQMFDARKIEHDVNPEEEATGTEAKGV